MTVVHATGRDGGEGLVPSREEKQRSMEENLDHICRTTACVL